jgi:hypothetical protein
MRNIYTMSVDEAVEWAETHPEEVQAEAHRLGVCAMLSEEGYYCTLSLGHLGIHVAKRPDGSLLKAWEERHEGVEWVGMKES